ncbi:MAG: ribonuclease T2 [Pseudomonadota bacterium]
MRTGRREVLAILILAFGLLFTPRAGQTDTAGAFDYYVMALSWSPNWCTLEGDRKRAPQCEMPVGWLLHGLWPQYEEGWPDYCPTSHAQPRRALTDGMADIMGSSGLAWHQWKKHGTCSGLTAEDYFRLSRLAYDRVSRPAVFRKLDDAVRLPASVVEEAFLKDNPGLSPDMLTVTCRDGYVQEVRVCLTRGMEPRVCGRDARRDCTLEDALFTPLR